MVKRPWPIGIILMLVATFLVYSNHFNNTFHFDDFHTIVNNASIKSLKNIPRFFEDGRTSSVLPQNQSYRPFVVASLAVDYRLEGSYRPFWFQVDNFMFFLAQGIMMVYLFLKIFDLSDSKNSNTIIALLAVTWYLLHPANAETVNYIIARTDIQSSFFVLLGFILFIFSPFCRKTYLYLLAIGVGALCKPTAVMFAPMLFCYILLFEEGIGFGDVFKKINFTKLRSAILKTLPALFFCILMYVFTDRMTPKSWEPGGTKPLQYLITQPFVILHYFGQFFIPNGLSADTDWRLLPSVWDIRFFAGCLFIVLMLWIMFRTSRKQTLRPISFGIAWFFLALIPTSSIIPLGEVLNDHRMYFPFIGLALSVTWTLALLLSKYGQSIKKTVIATCALLLLSVYAFGVYRRNIVWHSEASLWKDVTEKSPLNGRGQMNYAITLVEKGNYREAEKYLRQAEKIAPDYAFVYTNMGIVKEDELNNIAAENYYKAGIALGPNYPDAYFYYARFLVRQVRQTEAEPLLLKVLRLSPDYIFARTALMSIYSNAEEWDKLKTMAEETLVRFPRNADAQKYLQQAESRQNDLDKENAEIAKAPTAEKYIDLSRLNYIAGRFEQSAAAAQQALKLKPNAADAYNNMGAAYIKLQQYDKAFTALKQALALKPDFALAQNNLVQAEAVSQAKGIKLSGISAADYINLSLYYFNNNMFRESLAAAQQALALKPDYVLAYNNICAADNQLGDWNNAIDAANKGLQIDPNNQTLKNNLAAAIKGKNHH